MRTLQLDLFRDASRVPWEGRSPRSLTRVAKALFLSHKAQKRERFFVDPYQIDLFGAGSERLPRVSGGAPSLVPLPRRGDER